LTLGFLEHTYPPGTTFPTIPWAEIGKNPADFIDTAHYSLPTELGCPIPCIPIDTLLLYDYLREHQTLGDPFRFHTKSNIDERCRLSAQEVFIELLKDDEDLDDVRIGLKDSASERDDSGGQAGAKSEVRVFINAFLCLLTDLSLPKAPIEPTPPPSPSVAQTGSVFPTDLPLDIPMNPPHGSPPLPPINEPVQSVNPPIPPPIPVLPPANPPPLPQKHSKEKRPLNHGQRRHIGNLTNDGNTSAPTASDRWHRSARDRKQAQMDPHLVAGGQKSPKG
jgi:hypothetical protein